MTSRLEACLASLIVAAALSGVVFAQQSGGIVPLQRGVSVQMAVTRNKEKTLYIKADARVPYARLVEVIDAVQKSGVEGLTLLTAQQDAADQGKLVTPKGLEMRVVN